MNNLFPAPMLFALLVFPQNLSAQSATHCPMTADDANCVRVVACIGDEGVWFNGRAFGRGEGTFSGTTSTGLMCEGTWMSRNAFGLGQADVMCGDGRKGRVFYTYQDEYTGTAVGQGAMHSGENSALTNSVTDNRFALGRRQLNELVALLDQAHEFATHLNNRPAQ